MGEAGTFAPVLCGLGSVLSESGGGESRDNPPAAVAGMGERIARIVRISDFRNLSAALVDPRPYCDLKAQADSPFEPLT